MNLFAYCGNNPVNRFDPTGQDWIHWAIGAAIVAGFGILTVATCGWSLAFAATSVGLVASGIAASSAATTVAAAAFIGSATVYGTAALVAASNAGTFQSFAAQGNWWTVAGTAIAGGFGAINGYSLHRLQSAQINTSSVNSPQHKEGRGSPKNNPVPNGSYTQYDDFDNIYSYAQYDNLGRQTLRIDFQGKPHNGVLPHIHLFTYPEQGGRRQFIFDLGWNLIGRK